MSSISRDLQRKELNLVRHGRSVSEGDSFLARNSGPICIDSIQVSKTCTTESQRVAARSTTGGCSMFSLPDSSLFCVPAERSRQLDACSIPAVLRARFQQQGMPLSDRARVEVKQMGKAWFINDQGSKYSVRKLAQWLTIYNSK